MYTTAINVDHEDKTFSITCRNIKASRAGGWLKLTKNKLNYNDGNKNLDFDIVFEGGIKAAEKNKHRFEDAYELAGYTKISIK